MTVNIVTCTVCPSSCRVSVRGEGESAYFTGNQCPRGIKHAKSELTNPVRMLTTTVPVDNAPLRMLPVISESEIPKSALKECLGLLYAVRVAAPVRAGDIVIENILGTGVDIVAARSIKALDQSKN